MMGGVLGKVGPVVGIRWRDKYYWRSRPSKSKKEATEKQLRQRAKLALVSSFLSDVRLFINAHIPKVKGNRGMINGTEQVSSYLLKNSVGFEGEKAYLCMDAVTMSIGVLSVVHFFKLEVIKGKCLVLEWEDSSYNSMTSPDDFLSVIIFHSEMEMMFMDLNVGQRSSAKAVVDLPKEWGVGDLHLWTVWNNKEETLNSTSIYHRGLSMELEHV